MNKKIVLVIVLISLVFGMGIYKHYKNSSKYDTKLYVLQVGAYKDYDNIVKNTKYYDNYMVYFEEGLYKLFVGVSLDQEVYNKIKDTYVKDISSIERIYVVNNDEFIENINKYDQVLKNTNDIENMNLIIKEELKLLEQVLTKS